LRFALVGKAAMLIELAYWWIGYQVVAFLGLASRM
jgi:hypothetical protein